MTRSIHKILSVVCLIALVSCKYKAYDSSLKFQALSQNEAKQVEVLLKNLYRSFSYKTGSEPDWDLMRSVFCESAQFVTEAIGGESPRPQTIEEFIYSWQHSIRKSNAPLMETSEHIIDSKTAKIGKLIRIDVVFQASKGDDPHPRKYGLDSLVLANVDGIWKILSFVIHYESKLS